MIFFMDSAQIQWRIGVEGVITKLENNVQKMIQIIRDMSRSMGNSVPQSNPSPPVSNSHHVFPMYEPKLLSPEVFKRKPNQCRPFLTQCEICFQLQLSSLPTERSKVAFVISLLSGKTKLWGTAEWQCDSYFCYKYTDIATELTRVFDPVLPE